MLLLGRHEHSCLGLMYSLAVGAVVHRSYHHGRGYVLIAGPHVFGCMPVFLDEVCLNQQITLLEILHTQGMPSPLPFGDGMVYEILSRVLLEFLP